MFKLFGLIAGVLVALSYIPYTKDILGKRAKPERVSWLIWSVAATIAFFTQHAVGSTWSLWFAGLDAVGSVLTLTLSFKFGVGGFTRRDVMAIGVLVGALVTWQVTDNALLGLLMTISVDISACVLTIWKTLDNPDSETYPMWLVLLAASAFAVASVGNLSISQLVYPVYMFFATASVIAAIYFGRKLAKHQQVITGGLKLNAPQPTPALLGLPFWSNNPVTVGAVTELIVPIEHADDTIFGAECVSGKDPGPGKGTPMRVANGQIIAEITTSAAGTYTLGIRAQKRDGTWTDCVYTRLSVIPVSDMQPVHVDQPVSAVGATGWRL